MTTLSRHTRPTGFTGHSGRTGFTLIETVVTLGLLAVLAAFVVPTFVQKAGVADPVRIHNDLIAIRTAMEAFATDGKAGYPQQLSALTTRPVAEVTRLVDSTEMSAPQVSKWNGPYLSASITTDLGDSLPTGFGGYLMNFVDRYDSMNDVPAHSPGGALSSTFSATGSVFAAVRIDGLTPAQARMVNLLVDGGTDRSRNDGANTTGQFRYGRPVGGVVLAYYLAVPVAQ